jgi:hypothetical protein
VRARWVLAIAAERKKRGDVGSELNAHLSVLRAQKCPWTDGMILQLQACQEYLTGSKDRALALLTKAIAMLDTAEMEAQAAAFRYLLAQWLGGDEGERLRSAAATWASSQGIVNPLALFRMHAPGLIE